MAANEIDSKLLEENKNDVVDYLKLYQKEWEVIISTQMHFNDLIIRYRQIFLTLFLSVITAGFSLKLDGKISDKTFYCIVIAILVSWCLAFLLDYFYYYKLLLGSVEAAKKFDENLYFEKWGLFGLTKQISTKISPFQAKAIIWLFYSFPVIVVAGVIIYLKMMKPV